MGSEGKTLSRNPNMCNSCYSAWDEMATANLSGKADENLLPLCKPNQNHQASRNDPPQNSPGSRT
jgi:hypothetical protein